MIITETRKKKKMFCCHRINECSVARDGWFVTEAILWLGREHTQDVIGYSNYKLRVVSSFCIQTTNRQTRNKRRITKLCDLYRWVLKHNPLLSDGWHNPATITTWWSVLVSWYHRAVEKRLNSVNTSFLQLWTFFYNPLQFTYNSTKPHTV